MAEQYKIHPAATLFPMMSDEEYAGLKADIAENGLGECITLWRGQIIDGRNRLRACEELGVEPEYRSIAGDVDPYKYVISHNMHRRHLSTSQRAMIAAKMASLKLGDNQHSKEGGSIGEGGSIDSPSLDDAAQQLKVGRATVVRAKQIHANGVDELIEAVERDEISVSAGAEIAEMPVDDQKAVLAEGPEFARDVAAERRTAKAKAVSAVQTAAVPESLAPPKARSKSPSELVDELDALLLQFPDLFVALKALWRAADMYEKERFAEVWNEWLNNEYEETRRRQRDEEKRRKGGDSK